jgi:hypothetical protein
MDPKISGLIADQSLLSPESMSNCLDLEVNLGQGISSLNTTIDSPTIFGILTVNKIEEAHDRIGGKHGHKGEEAAVAALKMASLQNSFKTQRKLSK